MDNAFRTGDYELKATGGTSPEQTESITYAQDAYPGSIPAFTETTFLGLQGLDPTAPFTVEFNSFVTHPAANESYIFFFVYNTGTNQLAFSEQFLPPDTTSLELPANTLQVDVLYQFNLLFSSRIAEVEMGYREDQEFDFSSFGTFNTAVPEPGSGVLFGVAGLMMVAGLLVRRARKRG